MKNELTKMKLLLGPTLPGAGAWRAFIFLVFYLSSGVILIQARLVIPPVSLTHHTYKRQSTPTVPN